MATARFHREIRSWWVTLMPLVGSLCNFHRFRRPFCATEEFSSANSLNEKIDLE
ncbi:hypothetical protein RR48_00752 [Papilio machaon]|uniref:Uncharacterized protein n=1 Tax=Papilio machaon TaxID=76193 RepID=A0A0N1I6Y4_PAPMA|nr:hypothetical protein RR48_00752 [Papilio machaon]